MSDSSSSEAAKRNRRGDDGAISQCLHEVIAATEVLHHGIAGEASIPELSEALERRSNAFEALVALVDLETWSPNAAIRAALGRLRALDQDLIVLGEKLPRALRVRTNALHRRRSAIHAHASRERGEPRVLTVKA